MLFRVIGFHKRTIPPDDRLAVSQKAHGFCGCLHRITAALYGHKALSLNDLHKSIVDIFREVDLAEIVMGDFEKGIKMPPFVRFIIGIFLLYHIV